MPRLLTSSVTHLLVVIGTVLLWSHTDSASAQRPTASQILPENTLLYVRIDDSSELVERFQKTALGRISQDPAIRPLVADLYASAVDAFQRVEERIGASLGELLSIPQGEVCFALVPPAEGPPMPVLLIDAGQRLPIVQKLFERIEQLIGERSVRTEERLGDTRLIVHTMTGRRERQLVYVERKEIVIVTGQVDVAKAILKAWAGESERTLADNPHFATVMRRCAGSQSERPQLTAYVDPIDLFARATRNDLAAQTTLAMFPALGLNGVQAVGGSITLATDEYDQLTHLHLLLDTPRKGIPYMIALQSGDLEPEPWVPADVVSYTTLNWDLVRTYNTFEELHDAIRGEGELAASFESDLAQETGLDFRQDILEALEGRATYITWMVKPARLNSRANLIGLKLKDADQSRKALDEMLSRIDNRPESESYLGVTLFYAEPSARRAARTAENELMRRPDPAFAIVGDYLLLSDSSQLLKHAIATKREGSQLLADDLEFRLIHSKLQRLPGGGDPGMIAFDRPEEALRLLYDLATAEATREQLSRGAERSGFFRALDMALGAHPLPPFSAVSRYLAPGGSLVTNDETGLHYVNFTLRRK